MRPAEMGMRMRAVVVPPLFAALVACASTPDTAPVADPGVARGLAIARTYCAACHAVGRHDASKRRDAIPFRRLSELYPVSALGEAFAEGLVTGHDAMPEVRLPAEDVPAMLAYLEWVQTPR